MRHAEGQGPNHLRHGFLIMERESDWHSYNDDGGCYSLEIISVKWKSRNERSDNHIEHLVDTNENFDNIKVENGKYNPNQLDCEKYHARLDYYEDDGPKSGIVPTTA